MRGPIYSKNQTRVIQRKSLSHLEGLVQMGTVRMVNPRNIADGVVVLSRYAGDFDNPEHARVMGSGFDTAWGIRESGYAGPLVWQLKTPREKRQTAGGISQ